MRAIAPRIDGLPEITVGVCRFEDGQLGIITRWRLDEAERARIAAGEDLYVSLLTNAEPMQPLNVTIGEPFK